MKSFGTLYTDYVLTLILFCSVCRILPCENMDRNSTNLGQNLTGVNDGSPDSLKTGGKPELFSKQNDYSIPFWKSAPSPNADKNDDRDLGMDTVDTSLTMSSAKKLSVGELRKRDKVHFSISPPQYALSELDLIRYQNGNHETNPIKSSFDKKKLIKILLRKGNQEIIYIQYILPRFYKIYERRKKRQPCHLVIVLRSNNADYPRHIKNETDTTLLSEKGNFEPSLIMEKKRYRNIFYAENNVYQNHYFKSFAIVELKQHRPDIRKFIFKKYASNLHTKLQNSQHAIYREKRYIGQKREFESSLKQFFPNLKRTLLKSDDGFHKGIKTSDETSDVINPTNEFIVANDTSTAERNSGSTFPPRSETSNDNSLSKLISRTEIISGISSIMFLLFFVVFLAVYWVRRHRKRSRDPELQRLISVRTNTGIYYNQSGLCF